MIVLNSPLDGGFSGGPVVTNDRNHLVGMIVRTTDRQSRAVPSAKLSEALEHFEQNAIPYSDPLKIPQ